MRVAERNALLETYLEEPEMLDEAIGGIHSNDFAVRPAPDRWSIRDTVHHLADAELFDATHLRMMLAHEEPVFRVWSGAEVPARLKYRQRRIHASVELIRNLRQTNYDLMLELSEADWARTAIHERQGVLTVEGLLRSGSSHFLDHLEQIREVRRSLGI